MNRAQRILFLLAEEEYPVDNDPYFMDPKRVSTGAPAPATDHMPRHMVAAIPTGSPTADERREVSNTFPWNGQPIRSQVQRRVYTGSPSYGVSSGVGGITN